MKKVILQNISVRYITGDFTDIGLKDYVIQKLKRQYHVKEFWAVNDVSFSLEEGDLLGIIGSNGAGKSTLLKVISGIMCPTTGKMSVEGNIASLLELGTGFDGELTVRENTFLRGAMLGYTRDFMNKKYEEIIDFSGLGEFQDRLAFSIACLVNPDILILDEVLSVGDGAFRKKSERKMTEVIQNGATTLLVSHSLDQIRRMANKVLWLDKGRQIEFGDTKTVCDHYAAFLKEKTK